MTSIQSSEKPVAGPKAAQSTTDASASTKARLVPVHDANRVAQVENSFSIIAASGAWRAPALTLAGCPGFRSSLPPQPAVAATARFAITLTRLAR